MEGQGFRPAQMRRQHPMPSSSTATPLRTAGYFASPILRCAWPVMTVFSQTAFWREIWSKLAMGENHWAAKNLLVVVCCDYANSSAIAIQANGNELCDIRMTVNTQRPPIPSSGSGHWVLKREFENGPRELVPLSRHCQIGFISIHQMKEACRSIRTVILGLSQLTSWTIRSSRQDLTNPFQHFHHHQLLTHWWEQSRITQIRVTFIGNDWILILFKRIRDRRAWNNCFASNNGEIMQRTIYSCTSAKL